MDNNLIPIIFNTDPVIYSYNKVVLSGRFAEVYTYSKPIILNRRPKEKKEKHIDPNLLFNTNFQSIRADEYRLRRLSRAYSQISRYIECNFSIKSCIFMTLTFKYNMKSLKVAKNVFFKPFIARIKLFYPDFIYLAVTEFQKRGAVHFHMIINQALDIPVIEYLWPWGNVDFKYPYSSHGLGIYFSKYLTKNAKDKRYTDFKFFFCSHSSKNRKIIKPKILYAKDALIYRNFLLSRAVPVYSHVYTIPDFSKTIRPHSEESPIYVQAEKYNLTKFLPLDLRSYIL